LFENRSEAAKGAQVPHPSGGFTQTQDSGRLAVGELFEMAKQDHLALIVIQLIERSVEPLLQLLAQGFGRWGQRGIPELRRQVQRGSIGERARSGTSRQGPLAIETPLAGTLVLAVRIDDLVASDLPEPEVERQDRIAQIIPQPLTGFEEDVLDNVARVDTASESPIQTQPDHPTQGRAMPLPQFLRRGSVGQFDLL
jgi:hypothetical protein